MTWEELDKQLVKIREDKHKELMATKTDDKYYWYARGQYELVIELHVMLKEKYGTRT